jgi:hypothetical protein
MEHSQSHCSLFFVLCSIIFNNKQPVQMKKTVLSILIVFVVSTAAAFAQTTTGKTQPAATKTAQPAAKKACYVDENNNNVCDKYENHVCKNSKGTGNPDCKNKREVSTTTPPAEQPQKSTTQKPATK